MKQSSLDTKWIQIHESTMDSAELLELCDLQAHHRVGWTFRAGLL